ncbi:MAG: wax ester/triacylglycerol synthase family O-acyltransferase [Myxococcota bacterium]|nr:wax ester/triacylglycerol synthase family O-acyltransferase [Myxococcota bacterium]
MRQLGGSDDLWFAMDTDTTPMHFLEVAIYDPSTSEKGAIDLQDVKAFVGERLGGLPLRQKLVRVPWNADFPYWVEDESFDLDEHLHEVELKPPGDWPAFLATLEEIAEVPLDRSRPLWDLYLIKGLGVIEGVPEGAFALARKVHHGQFDGTNIMRLSGRLHSADPEAGPPPPDGWSPEPTPSGLGLLLRAPWNRTRRVWKGVEVLRENASRLLDLVGSSGTGGQTKGEGRPVPQTRFSGSIGTRRRVFDALVFPLEDVKAVRRHVAGATVNDVALAIATGAIRRYLEAHGELPEEPLVILVPVSAHTDDEEQGSGNRLSIMFVTLPTNEADPLERLRRVRDSTSRSKRTTEQIGAGNVADIVDLVPTYLMGLGFEWFVRLGLAERLPPLISGISITNVPGPRRPTYFNGARSVRGLGCPFLFDGMGLIIAISSYCDDFLVQFGSSPRMMPDPEFFRECIREAYEELAAAS